MIDVRSLWGWVLFFALTAILGAIGGFVAELLVKRAGRDSTGRLESFRRGKDYVDLGWVASVVVGMAAALAALWVFPPAPLDAASLPSGRILPAGVRYQLVDLVAVSIIVGSAGGAFLSALQTRALLVAKEQRTAARVQVADQHLTTLRSEIATSATTATLTATVDAARAALRPADGE